MDFVCDEKPSKNLNPGLRQVVCYRKERVGEGPIRGSVQKQCGKDWKKHMTGE